VLSLAGVAAPAHATPVVIQGADPDSYSLDLRYLTAGSGKLTGGERIEFVNRGPGALDRVWLRLWANGPDRCRPRAIDVRVEAPARAGAERERCSALEVLLPAPVAPGARSSISLRFTVRVRHKDDRFGHAGHISLLGNVIPVLAVQDDRGLHLEPYSGGGESFYSLAARWDATLELPASLHAATTGATLSDQVHKGKRTLRVGTVQARDFALAVGRLRVASTTIDGVRIRAFGRARPRQLRASLRAARRAVSDYVHRLAPFGGRELDMVLLGGGVGGFGGMEYPELIFTMPLPEVIAHEIAHQWWYGLVGDDQYHDPWLDESFASYFELREYPWEDACDPKRPYAVVGPDERGIPLDSSMKIFNRRPVAYGDVVYGAGPCALETLEADIGRVRTTAFFRLLQARFRFGVVRQSDVLQAIRDVAPRFDVAAWERLAHLRGP
jgi:peptidase M1-like protein